MQRNSTQQHTNKQSGFTLVEMLVALSLFTIVITMSVGTLLVLIDANGRAQSMQLVMTNLSFALDSMTREIRTGEYWYCGNSLSEPTVPGDKETNDCTSTSNYLSVIETEVGLTQGLSSNRITYWYDENSGAIFRKLGGQADSSEDWVVLTGEDISIYDMRFIVTGTDRMLDTGDAIQPTATIYIEGQAGFEEGGVVTPKAKSFALQTTVTQRVIDI